MRKSNPWKLKLGGFLFKYRSFTPIPFIVIVFVFFKPTQWGKTNIIVILVGLLTLTFGEMIRIITIGYSYSGSSGRENFMRADNLNIDGMYSIIRNPLYIGNFFVFTGLLIIYSNVMAILLCDIFLIIQYHFIILAEENFLLIKYRKAYEDYCKRIPKIIPTFRWYQKTGLKFDFKKSIFQEKSSILNLLTMLFVILAYKEKVITGEIKSPFIYIIPLSFIIGIYLILKVLNKRIKE